MSRLVSLLRSIHLRDGQRAEAYGASVIFLGALTAALFYHGHNIAFLGLAQALLVVWLLRVAWQGYAAEITVPKTLVTSCITLFWVWSAASLAWTPVLHTSTLSFWLIGTLPLVFWLFTLAPDRDRVWNCTFVLLIGTGLTLAAVGAWQLLLLHVSPRSVFLNINSHAALLNLIALPVAGYFLSARARGERWDARSAALALALFVLVYGMAITRGRAAALTFLVGAGLLLAVSLRRLPKKDLLLFVGLIATAFVLANLSWHGGVRERMETLYDLGGAGATRFIIWRQSWAMLQDGPWWGRGLGLYGLEFPRYRDPSDSNAGYFVHNDYLQIWIELGLPGLVLFIAVMLGALWMFVRAMRSAAMPAERKIEMAGLFSGLVAIALHSFLDFNFYVLAILTAAGLMLGRFHSIAMIGEGANNLVLNPSSVLGPRAYRIIVGLLALSPLIYFISIGVSALEYERALKLAGNGRFQEADAALSWAARLSPSSDNVLLSQADLYRHLLSSLPVEKEIERNLLFTQASRLLDRAERLNSLNPRSVAVRGQLLEENPKLAAGTWPENAIQAYQQSLKLNPRHYHARLKYAKFLYRLGRRDQARRVVEDGMRHWYYETEDIVPYYAFVARLRLEAGEKDRGIALANTVERILKDYGWRKVPAPERPMFKAG